MYIYIHIYMYIFIYNTCFSCDYVCVDSICTYWISQRAGKFIR